MMYDYYEVDSDHDSSENDNSDSSEEKLDINSQPELSEKNDSSDSEHDSSEEKQDVGSEPIHTFEPFDIVLVDIRKAATEDKIHCVKKQLAPGVDLKYVAISYRWGELQEDLVAATDYNAHITSFRIEDFKKLCLAISKEVDLCTMQYVWVDAICIDQVNETHRKATIYHMNDIYECANWILAVPDLHLGYLLKNPLNCNVIEWIKENAEYIYYLDKNNGEYLSELHKEWMLEELHIPKHLLIHAGCLYPSTPSVEDDETDENPLFEALMLFSKEYGENNVLWNCRSVERQISKLEDAICKRRQMVKQAFTLFDHLIFDWATRTWVISEYSIAKKKNNNIIKYWFVSLHNHVRYADCSAFKFFDSDIDLDSVPVSSLHSDDKGLVNFIKEQVKWTWSTRFKFSEQTESSDFMKNLLGSNASKNIDRFYAILPLSEEFRHHIKDGDTIKSWQITDLVSVRMRVRQWLAVVENIHLLYDWTNDRFDVILPSFDELDMKKFYLRLEVSFLSYIYGGEHSNYDIESTPPAVEICDAMDKNSPKYVDGQPRLRYSMLIRPRGFLVRDITVTQDIINYIGDNVWKNLELDPSDDHLSWISIPRDTRGPRFSECYDEQEIEAFVLGSLLLFGSLKKNIWIKIKRHSELFNDDTFFDPLNNWQWYDKSKVTFRVY